MERKEMIEKMAKIITKTYEKHGVFNPKWFAEAIYDKIFPDGAVVLTKEEYERLNSYISEDRAREIFHEETEKLKDKIRKETASEILQDIFSDKNCIEIGGKEYVVTIKDKKRLAEKFGLEVE